MAGRKEFKDGVIELFDRFKKSIIDSLESPAVPLHKKKTSVEMLLKRFNENMKLTLDQFN